MSTKQRQKTKILHIPTGETFYTAPGFETLEYIEFLCTKPEPTELETLLEIALYKASLNLPKEIQQSEFTLIEIPDKETL